MAVAAASSGGQAGASGAVAVGAAPAVLIAAGTLGYVALRDPGKSGEASKFGADLAEWAHNLAPA